MLRLSAPTQIVFYTSLALAVFSVGIRALVYAGMIPAGSGGYLILFSAYLVLLTGVISKKNEKHRDRALQLNVFFRLQPLGSLWC